MAKASTTDRQAQTAQQVTERRTLRFRDALRSVMDMDDPDHGRLFVDEIIQMCGVFRRGFTADAMRLQFEAGEREVGLKLLLLLEDYAPVGLRKMEVERSVRQAQDAREDERVAEKAEAETA